MIAYCFQRHVNSIVDDDQEQFQILHNKAYFQPTFPRPICACNCNFVSATSDNYYGVLDILIMVHRMMCPKKNALYDGVVVETSGESDSKLIC